MLKRFISSILVLIISSVFAFSIPLIKQSAIASEKAKTLTRTSNNSKTISKNISRDISAESAILLDMSNGDVLWTKNADEERPIASTTKIMTAILAIEYGNLNDDVEIDKDVLPVGAKGGIGLSPGEKIKLKDLLYALMLSSANDSAVAISKHISDSIEKFSYEMNKKAVSIGALHSNFNNPHGLDDKKHYSTARDLSTIALYALKNKVFADIVSTKTKILARRGKYSIKRIKNSNKLLLSYSGAKGVKTGYTNNAGFCLVASAKRNGISLLSVILDAKSKELLYKESTDLLDYGFGSFENRRVLKKGKTYKTITSKYGQDLQLTSDRDLTLTIKNSSATRVVLWSDSNIEVPCKIGKRLGKIAVLRDDKVIATANLIANNNLERPSLNNIMAFYWTLFIDFII